MGDTYLANSIRAAKERAEYDESAKRLLSDKQVLARILQVSTTEFAGMDVDEIIPCIEPPSISTVEIFPGSGEPYVRAIEGVGQESLIPGEGRFTYDIRFVAVVPSKGRATIRIIVDLEAQKTPYPGYDIVTRGIFYGGRMLSEQYGKTFTDNDYDKLEKVYSIWIVMNCPEKAANTISKYGIAHTPLYGSFTDDARSDLINVVMIRLPADGGRAKQPPSEIHKVLSTLLSPSKQPNDKIRELEKEHGFSITGDLRREVDAMCNLSDVIYEQGVERGIKQGIERGIEQGIERGIEQGIEQGRVAMMYELARDRLVSVKAAADVLGLTEKDFREAARQNGYVLP